MRTLYLIAAAAAVLLLGSGTASAQIATSAHDMTLTGVDAPPGSSPPAGTATGQVCVYCHTPHGGNADAPLWNRNNPAGNTFTMYTSDTLDNTIHTEPEGVSLACLSCHDGVTGYNSLVNLPNDGEVITGALTGTANVGKDLSNDHPISIAYVGDAGVEFVDAVGGKVDVLPLYGGSVSTAQVECASCHDPHDTSNTPFLRKSNAASGLCTTCHVK